MKPEIPWALAGGLSLIGGYIKTNSWPPNGVKSLAATGAIVVVASLTEGTRLEKVVEALGWLAVMGVALVALPEISQHAMTKGGKAAETGKALK